MAQKALGDSLVLPRSRRRVINRLLKVYYILPNIVTVLNSSLKIIATHSQSHRLP